MQPNFDQYDYSGGNSYNTPPPNHTFPHLKLIIFAVCVLAVIATAWALISAVNKKNQTGVINVTIADANAEITILQPNADPIQAGHGSVTARVAPGDYTVMATSGDKKSFKTTTVTQQAETAVDLTLEDLKEPAKVSADNAANIWANNSNAYFLNTDNKVPNSLRFGDTASKPFATSLYPVERIFWASPNSFFVLKNQTWLYVSNSGVVELKSGDDMPGNADAAGFGKSGAYAFVTSSGNVMYAGSPTTQASRITNVGDSGHRVSVAPNNSLLIYPITDAEAGKFRLFQNGKLSNLGNLPAGIQQAEWAPGSTKFSYTTSGGIFIYDTAKSQSIQVLSGNPTNVDSQVWLDDNTLIFAQDKAIWKYTAAGGAVKLVGFEGVLAAYHPLSLASDSANLYYGTSKDDDGKGGGLYRLSLGGGAPSGQPAPAPAPPTPQPVQYSGFEALKGRGMTVDQLNNAQYAISQYVRSKRPNTKVVGVPANGIQPTVREPGADFGTINFTLTLDSTKLKARIDFGGVSTVRVYLYNEQGGQVFDSGEIKS